MSGPRFRSLLAGPASVGLVALMLLGCLFLWIGVPLTWLWIGSQVQGSASLGTALMITMLGIVVSIVALVSALSWLNRRHAQLREARNLPAAPQSALEAMLVATAAVAVVAFSIWFFGFAGTSPIPVNVGF